MAAPNIYLARLAQPLQSGGSETTVYVDRITTLTGETIETADFSLFTKGHLTINPEGDGRTSYPEYVSFTAVDATNIAFTGVIRGLSAKSSSVVNANKRYHAAGTRVAITFGTHDIQDIIDYIDSEIGALTVGSNMVVTGTAGETIAAGNVVYLNVADSRWYLADADNEAKVYGVQLGIAQGSGTTGNTITNGVMRIGTDNNQSGLSVGDTIYISNTAGAISTTAGTNSKKIGVARSATSFYFDPGFNPPVSEEALVGGGNFGTPGPNNQFLTEEYNASAAGLPIVRQYRIKTFGSSTTRFDITNPSGTTFRYTWDGTGTNPLISDATVPVGSMLTIAAQNFNAANNGTFIVTGVGSNYFEVTNSSGVAENDKTLGTGNILFATTWSKPAGLKYVVVEVLGAGSGGQGSDSNGGTNPQESGSYGAAGAYGKKIIPAALLNSTETVTVGAGGAGGAATVSGLQNGSDGGTSSFGAHVSATGGTGAGVGGTATGGNLNVNGGNRTLSLNDADAQVIIGSGISFFGAYPAFGSGGPGGNAGAGTAGADGLVIVTEYYS